MQLTETINPTGATATYGRGRGLSIEEMDAAIARQTEGSTPGDRLEGRSLARLDGPALIFTKGGRDRAAIPSSRVSLNVKNAAGEVLFRWTVDIVIDVDHGRVRRGRQVIEPIGNAEVTASMIRRHARLGDAWVEAVELATIGENDPLYARIASVTPSDQPQAIDFVAERHELAAWVNEAAGRGERLSTEQLRQKLSKHRGRPVTAGAARQVKCQARKLELIPDSDNNTRPSI